MEIAEFKKKLEEICALASNNNKVISAEKLKETLQGIDLDKGQLVRLLQYLTQQGITVEGVDVSTGNTGTDSIQEERKAAPLTQEEKEYLKQYKQDLAMFVPNEKTTEELFAQLLEGNEDAKAELASRYFIKTAELAAELNCEEIFLADLIQEANVSLLAALDSGKERLLNEERLCQLIQEGIGKAISQQEQTKFQDDCLVAKVQKLESAVRDLSEDDGETKFTVNELAIILDMDVEEIQDILRLTGDN